MGFSNLFHAIVLDHTQKVSVEGRVGSVFRLQFLVGLVPTWKIEVASGYDDCGLHCHCMPKGLIKHVQT